MHFCIQSEGLSCANIVVRNGDKGRSSPKFCSITPYRPMPQTVLARARMKRQFGWLDTLIWRLDRETFLSRT